MKIAVDHLKKLITQHKKKQRPAMNKILCIGIFGALAYGVYRLFGMKQISKKVVSHLSKPRVHKVDLRGIVHRTEIKTSGASTMSSFAL